MSRAPGLVRWPARRHGVRQPRRDLKGSRTSAPKHSGFKAYEPGYITSTVDNDLTENEGLNPAPLSVCRHSTAPPAGFSIRIYNNKTAANRALLSEGPGARLAQMRNFRTILTDNGKSFTGTSLRAAQNGPQSGKHEFAQPLHELDIEHALTPPRSPSDQTYGGARLTGSASRTCYKATNFRIRGRAGKLRCIATSGSTNQQASRSPPWAAKTPLGRR